MTATPVATDSPPAGLHDDADLDQPVCGQLPLTRRIEALLLTADRPLTDARLAEILGIEGVVDAEPEDDGDAGDEDAGGDEAAGHSESDDAESADTEASAAKSAPKKSPRRRDAKKKSAGASAVLRAAITELNDEYAASERAFRIEAVAGGWQTLTTPAFGPLLARLRGERQAQKITPAALETLAIVAYRQPILRADLESIRGVACGEVLRSLMERRMVRIVGRAEEVGRPMLYGTTSEFLKVFGLANLKDLPNAKELRPV